MKEFSNILHLLELTANAAEWLYDGWFPRQGSRYLGSHKWVRPYRRHQQYEAPSLLIARAPSSKN